MVYSSIYGWGGVRMMDILCTVQVLFFLVVSLISFVIVILEKIISLFDTSLKHDV